MEQFSLQKLQAEVFLAGSISYGKDLSYKVFWETFLSNFGLAYTACLQCTLLYSHLETVALLYCQFFIGRTVG